MSGAIVFGGNLVMSTGISIQIDGSPGAPGQVLTTSGSGLYWANSANGGSSLLAGSGLTSNATHYSVLANTGIIANSSGLFVNSSYISSISPGVNTAAQYNWTNTHTFSANVSLNNNHLTQTTLKGYKEFVSNVTAATTSQTLDLSTTNIFNLVLNNNPIALTFTNPPPAGTMYTFTLVLTQDSIGSRTVTYPANATTVCKFTDNITPILSTGAGKTDFVQFLTYDGGNTYFGALSIANT